MRVSLLPQQVSSIELLHLFGDVSGMPAVVIGGEQDRVIARRKLESIHQQLPHSSYCLLSFCGHLAHEECPSELLMLLETLVAQAVKSSPTVNERIVSSLGGNAAGQHEGDMMPT